MTTSNEDARRAAVIREWDVWAHRNPELAKGNPIIFFTYLQATRQDLLEFESHGTDKWQVVHGWLLHKRRVRQ